MSPKSTPSGRGLATAFCALMVACTGGGGEPLPTLELGEPTLSGRVAMTLYDHAHRPHVWLVDVDGENLAPIEDGSHATSQPRFSRDGTRLAYVSAVDGLCILDLVVNRRQQVVADGSRPTWSPNGDRLAWVDSVGRIQVRELATGVTTTLWRSPEPIEAIEWSPTRDVLAVAFEGRGQVSRFGLDVGLLTVGGGQLTTIGGWFSDVRWSPDGKMLGADHGLIDGFGRAVIGGDGVHPFAWSGDGKGQIGIARAGDRLGFALTDLQGEVVAVLPMPPDMVVPMFFDYGSLWVDWSWD